MRGSTQEKYLETKPQDITGSQGTERVPLTTVRIQSGTVSIGWFISSNLSKSKPGQFISILSFQTLFQKPKKKMDTVR